MGRSLSLLFSVILRYRKFFKYHRVEPCDVEECAPFLRRYYWDMEGAMMAPAALARREAWLADRSVDKTWMMREMKVGRGSLTSPHLTSARDTSDPGRR